MKLTPTPDSDRPERGDFPVRLMMAWLFTGLAVSSNAQGLIDFHKAALEYDPKFQSALFENIAGQEFGAISRAGLLPSVSASYNYGKNYADRSINGVPLDKPQYDSKVATLSVRQPLFNLDAWQRYKGGQSQVNFSDTKLAADEIGRAHV